MTWRTMEKNIKAIINQKIPFMNPALKRIGVYILDNLEECKTITTKSLALTCKVAESTVTRFVREIGLSSFQELKINIAEFLTTDQLLSTEDNANGYLYENIDDKDSLSNVIDKLVYRNTLALTETQLNIDQDALIKAVKLIDQCQNMIVVSQGFSSVAAKEAVLRFARVGKRVFFYDDESTMLIFSSVCTKNDLILGISNTGRTSKIIQALEIARECGAKTVSITSFADSQIVGVSDVTIITPTKTKTIESGTSWESASSKTAQILVIDILCAWYSLQHYDDSVRFMDSTYKALKNTRHPKNTK